MMWTSADPFFLKVTLKVFYMKMTSWVCHTVEDVSMPLAHETALSAWPNPSHSSGVGLRVTCEVTLLWEALPDFPG